MNYLKTEAGGDPRCVIKRNLAWTQVPFSHYCSWRSRPCLGSMLAFSRRPRHMTIRIRFLPSDWMLLRRLALGRRVWLVVPPRFMHYLFEESQAKSTRPCWKQRQWDVRHNKGACVDKDTPRPLYKEHHIHTPSCTYKNLDCPIILSFTPTAHTSQKHTESVHSCTCL